MARARAGAPAMRKRAQRRNRQTAVLPEVKFVRPEDEELAGADTRRCHRATTTDNAPSLSMPTISRVSPIVRAAVFCFRALFETRSIMRYPSIRCLYFPSRPVDAATPRFHSSFMPLTFTLLSCRCCFFADAAAPPRYAIGASARAARGARRHQQRYKIDESAMARATR